MRLDRTALRERLNARVAVGAEENADGHVQILVQLVREGQRQGGEAAGGADLFPAVIRGGSLLRVERGHRVDVDLPNEHLVLGRGEVARELVAHALVRSPNHVGLTAGKPHFTDEHALEGNRLTAAVFHLKVAFGARDFQRIEPHHPVAVLVRNGGLRLPGELHRHFRSRHIPTPNRHGGFALQDRVVCKRRGQFQRLLRGRQTVRKRNPQDENEYTLHY